MTPEQPKALMLAMLNEDCARAWIEGSEPNKLRAETAAELRRLHAVEVKALSAEPTKNGYKMIPLGDLHELYSSINGDCYMGEDWEKKCIFAMLSASPAEHPAESNESVLIDGIAYPTPAPVAAELLRLHIELLQATGTPS